VPVRDVTIEIEYRRVWYRQNGSEFLATGGNGDCAGNMGMRPIVMFRASQSKKE
jgi:hypothetical protein